MKKKLAIIINSLGGGGAERIVSYISLYLNDPDLPILLFQDIVEYDYCGKKVVLPSLQDTVNKCKSRFLGKVLLRFSRFTSSYYRHKQVKFLKEFKQKNSIDVTLSLSMANTFNILSRGVSDKAVISIRCFRDVYRDSERIEGTALSSTLMSETKRLYSSADGAIVISTPIKDRLISDFGMTSDKIKIIYNPIFFNNIHEQATEELPKEHHSTFAGTVFITVCSLKKIKGQYHMIRAFSKTKQAIPDAKLVILGKGSLQHDLEALAEGYSLNNSVVFLGFQSNPFKYMKKSSVFVFSSLSEGFGNVITEAMACGLPVISTDCMSGPREIIAPGTPYGQTLDGFQCEEYGILCPVCDGVFRDADVHLTEEENILADAMITLAQDKDLRERYSKKGPGRAQDFDIEKILPDYIKVLESV